MRAGNPVGQLFLSTLPQGERPNQSGVISWSTTFLSTLPQGERPGPEPAPTEQEGNFYPRSRKGSDPVASRPAVKPQYFYPRSGKGSYDPGKMKRSDAVDFYPRSRKGSDLSYALSPPIVWIFLSTLPQGERLSSR